MSDYQSLNHRHLFSKLSKYARNSFTGRLSIKIDNSPSWRIYFNAGLIIWATGGIHPVRRWLRQLKGCNCKISIPQGMTKRELLSSSHECWDYFTLAALMLENNITPEQVKYIVEGSISEVLFDIVQAFGQIAPENVEQIKMSRKSKVTPCESELLLPTWMWRTEAAKQRILVTWNSWVATGLNNFSPNSGITPNLEELKVQKMNSVAQYFLSIEREQKTLRDLALEHQKNILSILRTMKGYFDQGIIQFNSVPDLWVEDRSSHHQNSFGFHQGEETAAFVGHDHEPTTGENTEAKAIERPFLSTPMSGWLENSKQKSSPYAETGEEGVKVNVMENLVAIEVEKQLKSFPQKRIENISKLDVITYALNRLPPLYAASKEGIAHQTEEGKENYQEKIKLTVQLAIAQVRRDPIRKATRITSPSYLGKMSVEGSDGV